MSYIYLAQPYSDPDHIMMQQRYIAGCEATAILLNNDRHVYAPIVHCHEIAKLHDLPRDFPFWRRYNYAMLAPANLLLVLQLPGWDISTGVGAEIDFARDNDIEVDMVTPRELEQWLQQ